MNNDSLGCLVEALRVRTGLMAGLFHEALTAGAVEAVERTAFPEGDEVFDKNELESVCQSTN
ncbi:MAG: hypothetical protein V1809_10510 [Planctomycetota bacterium]